MKQFFVKYTMRLPGDDNELVKFTLGAGNSMGTYMPFRTIEEAIRFGEEKLSKEKKMAKAGLGEPVEMKVVSREVSPWTEEHYILVKED